jgi:hypothetical protein
MKSKLLLNLLLFLSATIFAQNSIDNYFQGFQEEVSGKRFGYHSPFPDVNASLILRGQADYLPIEWKTETIPSTHNKKFVNFIWVFACDVTSTPVTFHLSVNNKKYFSFESSKTSDLGIKTIKGKKGSSLTFNVTMLDKYKDQMGFVVLKLPVDAIKLGEPAILKLEADAANNNAWFMTFKTSLEENIEIYQNKVVVKDNGKLFHSISADFIHIGPEAIAEIKIGDIKTKTTLKAGFNKVEINLPKVEEQSNFTAEIKIGNHEKTYKNFSLAPIRKWEILLVQHTHTDIGYTRPQTEILPEHLKYIDNALNYCDLTDDYPDDAKFRWTCETSWSVREYIKSRPQEQVDRLLKRLKEGRIEVTGMFFNFSDIIDESALAAQTKTLKMLKDNGIEVNTLMQNDVTGIAWCLVDYYNNTDVKYLNMGVHGHRARIPFDKPTAFWWQSPAGNKLLAYRSEHYQHGNSLGLTTGQQDVLRTNLSNYLSKLEEKEYPYNKISLQFSGYITDNSPPSTKACDIIKAWNEKYEWPKLRSALAKEFMVFLEESYSDSIETKKVAWPDWWTDGIGSAANETKVTRTTQVEIAANTALLSMAKILGTNLPDDIQNDISDVYDNLLFYDEHTMGAAESVSDPLAQNTINQWNLKSSYAWEAAKKSSMLQEKALAFIQPFIEKSNLPTIAIFNTLSWKRSGMVKLFIEYEVLPETENFTITDAENNELPIQVFERRMEGAYYGIWVKDIPPMGFKTLQINVGQKPSISKKAENKILENEYFKISFDKPNNIISQIYDKQLQTNIIDSEDSLGLGHFIYEQLANRHDLERLTASNRDTVYKALDLKRSLLSNIKFDEISHGNIYSSLHIHGDMPVCADERGVNIEIRLYHFEKKIELLYQMFKLEVNDPEGVYITFPFELQNGNLAFEAQGGVVFPGKNQLERTSSDWNTIQNFAAVKSEKAQILFTSNDIPLVQFGNLNIGRYYYKLPKGSNHIYSWVMNNYWVTNFKASQKGEFRWAYFISSTEDNSDMAATKFGYNNRVPLLSRVILPEKESSKADLVSHSFFNLDSPNLLLVQCSPSMDGKGIILHLREIEGDHAIIDVRKLMDESGAISCQEVNILEEEISKLTSPLLLEHFETKFIKLNFY